jgi:sulfite oxidase
MRAIAGEGQLLELSPRPENYETPVELLVDRITPLDRFYIRSHFDRPKVDLSTWKLSIGGLTGKPRDFTLADLEKLEQVTIEAVLQCAGNGRGLFRPRMPGVQWMKGAMGNAEWTGVRVRDLLRAASPKKEAKHLELRGADVPLLKTPPFVRGIPIEKALHPDTLIALKMNGKPLPPAHGAPARIVVPGWVGDDWVKWITNLTLLAEEPKGFYYEKAYRYPITPGAPGEAVPPEKTQPMTQLPVKSVIALAARSQLPAGSQEIRGVAFSGEASIAKVEVSLDGGAFTPAALDEKPTKYGWRVWSAKLDLAPGKHVIRSRATDENGAAQPETAVWNPPGYLHNAIDSVEIEARGAA